jgi:exoribonuclease-2
MLVAEMMILAGEAVGQLGASASLPLPYRGQETPKLPPESVINALPEGPCKGFALRKCMTRSIVSSTPVRHASLALDAYVQFTSPIRRYTDIIAHFNIKVR